MRKTLRKWHLWLGWLVGVPLLFWTLSGFFMVLKPIEEVRGEHLLKAPAPIALAAPPRLPAGLDAAPLEAVRLEPRARGPVWVVDLGERTRIADAATGEWLAPYGANDAAAEVAARYRGSAALDGVRAIDPADPPTDWRRPVPAWQVAMDDGTRFYVEAESGRIAATRTGWWRAFDWMWGLHIMDLETREDFNNNWLRIFAALAMLATLMALVLLPLATRRKKRARG
ncbi:PepSY domain-containing protein [Sphingomicrobium astaxanthinifaciens]|uniref:PepSY domain-containing protein n=1 Tax=Sphingomicrobium astaxanthinifaciens TaxID=1227949 RepID=UPI001FCB891F|nr:PepSY domain-containing protein [Sphingomicrobium astaxanthinifaciens]MCJ7421677.1 PepSY domain-containing protein [Sphingomicrobium astaxanthinifaciens]